MIIAGAGGHAREIFDLLKTEEHSSVYFFDNVHHDLPNQLFGRPILQTEVAVKASLAEDSRFVVGTGNPAVRKKLYELFLQWGAQPFTIVASTAKISEQQTNIGEGANIMHDAFISNQVQIGKGCLINTRAHLHHDVVTGDYCEIGPAALLLGNVQIGDAVFIGAGVIVLPGITIGDAAVIGAGAVVTKHVAAGCKVKGNPAR